MKNRTLALVVILTFVLFIGTYGLLLPSKATTQTKIEHVVFIIQENHSFDNYFGTYPGANGFGNRSILIDPQNASSGYISPFHITHCSAVLAG